MLKEVWKDIEGYEGFYQVSNLGRVKSLKRTFIRSDGKTKTFQGKVLKHNVNPKGYKYVNLSCQSKIYSIRIHRLVAKAFLENPNNYPCINHIDENKLNNNIENLEWCTYQYNNTYNNKQRCRMTKVSKFSKRGEFIRNYDSITEAGKDTGADGRNISACCRKKIKSCGGYVWKYA